MLLLRKYSYFINVFFVNKLKLFNRQMLREKLDRLLLVDLLKFALMSLVSALVVPVSTLVIRKYVFDNFSGNEAGYVQGIWSISNTYLSVVTTTLSIYYLPTLSGIQDRAKLRAEIKNGYKFILPLAVLAGVMIFIFRDLIINILYTPEFLPMREYFTFQIIGDGLKIASWILAYLMVAKAMTRLFIVTKSFFLDICAFLSCIHEFIRQCGCNVRICIELLLVFDFDAVFVQKNFVAKSQGRGNSVRVHP